MGWRAKLRVVLWAANLAASATIEAEPRENASGWHWAAVATRRVCRCVRPTEESRIWEPTKLFTSAQPSTCPDQWRPAARLAPA
jgi:hypothetical protein